MKPDLQTDKVRMFAHPRKDDSALFDSQTGRLDAVRIAEDMRISIDTVAKAIGIETSIVCQQPDSSAFQVKLWPIYRIWVSLVDLYAGDRANASTFLTSPNRHLENRAPVTFIENGEMAPLELIVDAMTDRQPA